MDDFPSLFTNVCRQVRKEAKPDIAEDDRKQSERKKGMDIRDHIFIARWMAPECQISSGKRSSYLDSLLFR